MIDRKIVEKKMDLIGGYIKELEEHLVFEVHDILHENDHMRLHAIERLFQLTVDTMIDINTHIIRAKDITLPDDYESTFEVLGQHKVFPMEFSYKLAPVVGLRNHVVHKYEKLDLKHFLRNLKDNLEDFKKFLAHIQSYLDAQKS